jgi:hypothetical protein
MDYGKSGNPKNAKDSQRDHGLAVRGAPKEDAVKAAKKAALLARMKAAASKKAD